MTVFKNERLESLLSAHAAHFLLENSLPKSLITITRAGSSSDLKRITFYISVYPDSYEYEALEFCKRKRSELREYIREKSRLRMLPMFDFDIDMGEKNRQRVDVLLKEAEK